MSTIPKEGWRTLVETPFLCCGRNSTREFELVAQPLPRQSLYNWGKSTQTLFYISIKSCFRLRKSYLRILQNDKEKMVRPWVELEKGQCERLKELQDNTGKAVFGMIREAVSNFVTKGDYSINIGTSHLPRATRENYRRVTTYLSKSDLSLLACISKETGRCKTHLIREAVYNYLGSTVIRRAKRNLHDNHAD